MQIIFGMIVWVLLSGFIWMAWFRINFLWLNRWEAILREWIWAKALANLVLIEILP